VLKALSNFAEAVAGKDLEECLHQYARKKSAEASTYISLARWMKAEDSTLEDICQNPYIF